MSISTTESTASVRALDAWNKADSAWQSAKQDATEEIRMAFAVIGVVPLKGIALPRVTGFGGPLSEKTVNAADAIRDMLDSGPVLAQVLKVIADSECPHVAKLKDVLCDEYIDDWADALADQRSPA